MTGYKYLIILLITILTVSACTSVRNTTFRNHKAKSDVEQAEFVENYAPRFVDTTFIKMPDVVPSKANYSNDLNNLFEEALKDFDAGNFSSAKQKFINIKNTVDNGDELYYESDFYIVECIISENKFDDAEKLLETMLVDKGLPDNILERVLVRLGQINCARNDKKEAAKYFTRLGDINPNSIYLKVANCDFLNGGSK
ncbi:MAG: hypothetical protein KIT33_08755 [Candidatus Kapabacteria bacterium]|nr:hypothetical protein [Ignavibacteriota bacterium]MCW5885045.1 hypothetical protein [Candidatus Kapabacteria bacterium]